MEAVISSKDIFDSKLLLVDDAVPTLAVLAKTLSHVGYKNLRACDSAEKAIEELNSAHEVNEPFDLVICDWHMPNMTGLDLVKQMREDEKFENILFMMVTADTDIEKIVSAVKSGANGYMIKPVTAEQVSEKINKILNERDRLTVEDQN